MTIQMNNGKGAIVDEEDFEWPSERGWFATNCGYAASAGERIKGWRAPRKLMHREILKRHKGWTYLDGYYVDHINGDRLDNRKENLRRCTNQQNQWNTKNHKRNTSGFKGVSWNRVDKKWQVYLRTKEKVHFCGQFTDKIEAAKAYDKKAKEIHGEFARVNFEGAA